KHFTQQKKVTVVKADEKFSIDDIATSRFEAYDSLSGVYGLYVTLNRDPKLIEFSFILDWEKLKDKQKKEKVSKYACHELNFFIYQKDRAFFDKNIKSFLANKKDKTFLDNFLLGNDLTPYLKSWNYARLNIVEQSLLARRIQDQRSSTTRNVRDMYDLLPPDIEQFIRRFDTAVKGSALDLVSDGKLGSAYDNERSKWSEITDKDANRIANEPSELPAADSSPSASAPGFAASSPVTRKPVQQSGQMKRMKQKLEKKNKKVTDGKDDFNDAEDELQMEEMEEDGRSSRSRRGKGQSYRQQDAKLRLKARQLYVKLDKTEEWAENNYYRLPIEQQNAQLVSVNAFWNDLAAHDPRQPFFSNHVASATRNFTEMIMALAVLDLPFAPKEHKLDFKKAKMSLTSASPMIVFHEEIRPTAEVAEQTSILVSQNFFRHSDRYRYENNERFDKFVTKEFLIHTVYGCQVVVTNPTSTRQKLDILLQIPLGAMPVSNGKYTNSLHIDLQPYRTEAVEYYFYFPSAGKYQHYPVHVARNEKLIT
ncbi:MAG: hypothetical protein N2C12_10460, partial [Planctomycetales bacterium]